MTSITLSCDHCGAALEAPQDTPFVTCKACESRLEIGRSDSAVYTIVLEAGQGPSNAFANSRRSAALESLEREYRFQLEERGLSGHGPGLSLFSFLAGVLLLLLGSGVAISFFEGDFSGRSLLLAILVGLAALVLISARWTSGSVYEGLRRDYVQKCRALIHSKDASDDLAGR
jgi:hypothetical protein